MKKLTDTHIFLLLLLGAVALFLVVYFVPVKNLSDGINRYKSQNSSLRSEISELQVYHDNRAQYESDTETLKKEAISIVASYPSGYREEDFILEGIAMEKAAEGKIQYSSIRMNDPESLALISKDDIKKAELEGFEDSIEFVKCKVDYSNDITYDGLKAALAEAFASGYKANIESITYTKEENSVVLNGVISLGYYYVNGNGKEYVAPTIEPYEAGTNNIFLGGKQLELNPDGEQ